MVRWRGPYAPVVISSVRFTFLGTGTSAGVPAIGCDCPVCTSDDPRDRRLRTSALLEFVDPKGHPRGILLDAGPDLREQALRARMTRLDAILFTHNHVDHTWGLDEVRRFNVLQRGPIDVYASEHTEAHLRRVYGHIFEREQNVNDSFVATLIAHRVRPGKPFTLHGLRVTPIPLLHGKLPILGYRLEPEPGPGLFDEVGASAAGAERAEMADAGRGEPGGESGEGGGSDSGGGSGGVLPLAYCTDVSAIPPESWPLLTGLRTLVLDALRDRRHPTHLTLEQAVGIASEVDAAQTYFVHMSHDLGHAETMARLEESGHAPRMQLAWDGLVAGERP